MRADSAAATAATAVQKRVTAATIVDKGYGPAFHWEDPARFAADLVAFVAPEERLQAANGFSSAVGPYTDGTD
jgi:hypothetical protein